MRNIITQQYELESLGDQEIANEIQNPTGAFPPFLVATEIQRRQDMRKRFAAAQAQGAANQPTVMEQRVAEMGGGVAGLPGGMAGPGVPQGPQGPQGGVAGLPGAQGPQAPPQAAPRGFAGGGMVRSGDRDTVASGVLALLQENETEEEALAREMAERSRRYSQEELDSASALGARMRGERPRVSGERPEGGGGVFDNLELPDLLGFLKRSWETGERYRSGLPGLLLEQSARDAGGPTPPQSPQHEAPVEGPVPTVPEGPQLDERIQTRLEQMMSLMPDQVEGGFYDQALGNIRSAGGDTQAASDALAAVQMSNAESTNAAENRGVEALLREQADLRDLYMSRVSEGPSELEGYTREQMLSPEQVRRRQNAEALSAIARGGASGDMVGALSEATSGVIGQRDAASASNLDLMQQLADLENSRLDQDYNARLLAETQDVTQIEQQVAREVRQLGRINGASEAAQQRAYDITNAVLGEIGDASGVLQVDGSIALQNGRAAADIAQTVMEFEMEVESDRQKGESIPPGAAASLLQGLATSLSSSNINGDIINNILEGVVASMVARGLLPEGTLSGNLAGGDGGGGGTVDQGLGVRVEERDAMGNIIR